MASAPAAMLSSRLPMPPRKITLTLSEPQSAPVPVADVDRAVREIMADLQQGHRRRAAKQLRQVLAQAPGNAEALHLKGLIALQENMPDKAEPVLIEAVQAKPSHAVAWSNLGLAVARQKRHDEALRHFERALALAPDFADAHGNRGVSLNALRRFEDALTAYDRAIALNPEHGEAWRNRGVCLSNLNRIDEAVASYDRAESLNANDAAARWNRCLVRLASGEFAAAWPDYSWRWKVRMVRADPARPPFWLRRPPEGDASGPGEGRQLPHGVPCTFPQPFWDGTPTRGSVLVWPEQGVGEQIMFASVLAEARARVGAMALTLDRKLEPLFRRAFPDCRLISTEEAAGGGFDYQLPMGDLLNLFRQSSDDFLRRRRPYLQSDAARREQLRRAIAPAGERVVGLSWFSRNEEFGPQKTLSPELLGPLFSLPGIRFVDLQYGNTDQARAEIRRRFGIELYRSPEIDPWKDLDGLAALTDACDTVVTISTAVAHLAGALGKPVLLMLPHSQGRYWYWQTTREDSLWYPDMRLFRQDKANDWSGVIAQVRAALAGEDTPPPRH